MSLIAHSLLPGTAFGGRGAIQHAARVDRAGRYASDGSTAKVASVADLKTARSREARGGCCQNQRLVSQWLEETKPCGKSDPSDHS